MSLLHPKFRAMIHTRKMAFVFTRTQPARRRLHAVSKGPISAACRPLLQASQHLTQASPHLTATTFPTAVDSIRLVEVSRGTLATMDRLSFRRRGCRLDAGGLYFRRLQICQELV
jgi:hypothetical protein